MRDFEIARCVALVALTFGAMDCGRTVVAVDPYPCPDAGPTGCPPGLLDGLVGYWRLTDAAGSATVQDWSGWSNNGTLVALDPASAWIAGGPNGGGLATQGKGYVNVDSTPSIDSITDQVTVAAWMYVDGTIAEYATAISRQIGTGFGQSYHLSVNASQVPGLFIGTSTQLVYVSGPSTVSQQTWIHLAGTWDGTEAILYVGGVEVASASAPGALAPDINAVVLGGNENGPNRTVSELIPGRLDEIMLYRRALSADQIAQIASGPVLPGVAARR